MVSRLVEYHGDFKVILKIASTTDFVVQVKEANIATRSLSARRNVMQAVEFKTVIRNHAIQIPDSLHLDSGMPVKVVLLYSESPRKPTSGDADQEITEYFGCLPNFPERGEQGNFEQRLVID